MGTEHSGWFNRQVCSPRVQERSCSGIPEGEAPAVLKCVALQERCTGLMNQRFVENSMKQYKPESQVSLFSPASRLTRLRVGPVFSLAQRRPGQLRGI